MTTTQTTPARTVPISLVKIGPRQFRAGCAYKPAPSGIATGETCPQRKTAIRSLESTLRALGYEGPFPTWDVREAKPEPANAPASEPEVEEAPATERMLTPITGDEEDHRAEVADEAIQRALDAAPLMPSPATQMRPGKFSPLNGLDFWASVYLDACARFTDIEFPGESPREKVTNFRDAIDLVMREANCVGAWDRDPSGTPWVTRAQALKPEVFDPTRRPTQRRGRKVYDKVRTFAGNASREHEHGPVYAPGNKPAPVEKPFEPSPVGAQVLAEIGQVRAGLTQQSAPKPEATKAPAPKPAPEGNVVARAEYEGRTYLKLDSGRWAEEGTNIRPAREIRRALNKGLQAATPEARTPNFVPETDADKVAYRSAYVWATRLGGQAKSRGEDQRLAYKVGMCAAMRAQGASHPKFEAEVKAAGATEEYLQAQANVALEWLTKPAAQAA